MTDTPRDIAEKIVTEILADLTDRRNLRQAWNGIDEDIRSEISSTWQDIVFEAICHGVEP